MTDETKKPGSSQTPRSQGPQWTREMATEKQLEWLKMLGKAAARARSNLLASQEAKARGNVLELGALPSDEQDARDTVRRVLTALFAEPGDNVRRLRKAMETSRAETENVLTTLNVKDGVGPVNPDFNDYQYLGLDALLFSEELTAISPVEDTVATDGNVLVKREVLKFWTELLSKQAGEVEDFHYKISDYAANRNDSAKLELVLAVLRQYSSGGQWKKKHADALAELNTESIHFKSLAWLHHPGVIW
jgi:hypothetical protein